jgi:hypothetical protein
MEPEHEQESGPIGLCLGRLRFQVDTHPDRLAFMYLPKGRRQATVAGKIDG